jgi:hypothetical protein
MLGVWIAVAIGTFLIVADWLMCTPVDPRTHRRPPLKPEDRRRLFDMVLWTVGVATAVWAVPRLL